MKTNIDPALYLASYEASQKKGASRKRGEKAKLRGELIRVGPGSLTFVPEEDPSLILKIIFPGRDVCGVYPRREAKIIRRLQPLQDDLFGLPQVVAVGRNPASLLMTHIGPRLGDGLFATTKIDPDQIGTAWGTFAGKVWLAEKSIHTDICYGNTTHMPDGRVGIIDLASVRKGYSPEQMVFYSLYARPSFAVPLARSFEKITGGRLDCAKIERMQRRENLACMHTTTLFAIQRQDERWGDNFETFMVQFARRQKLITRKRPFGGPTSDCV